MSDVTVTAARAVGVNTVPTSQLKPNPHNPRMLFDKEPMDTLRASIRKVGILVPLTVYRAKDDSKYTILDGQRRWMCAEQLHLETVPINEVHEPNTVENIVTMFQIHKLRLDWELMPTALKVEVLMKELKETRESSLAILTGLDQSVVSRCKKLLSYSKKYRDTMLDPDPKKRVKADFFIELYAVRNDRSVQKFDWFSKNEFTDRMLEKYQNPDSGLKAVTDFRTIKQHINNAVKAQRIGTMSKLLKQYTFDDSRRIESLSIDSASASADARRLTKQVVQLDTSLGQLDVERVYGEKTLWAALETLKKTVTELLRRAERRPQ